MQEYTYAIKKPGSYKKSTFFLMGDLSSNIDLAFSLLAYA